MDIINNALFFLLQAIKDLLDTLGMTGGYGVAIILLTVGIRLALWPMNTAQTRSMKKMQELQPKLKQLQERHKDNPQQMQAEMMKFYAENKFNPLAGCLPMLIQLPIFIGLYGMLISPNFLAVAGQESFLFIDNLSQTLISHAGEPNDATMDVEPNDKFVSENGIDVTFASSGKTVRYPVRDTRKALNVEPLPLIPGEPMTVTLNARYLGQEGFTETFIKQIESAKLTVVNDGTKEVETLSLQPVEVAPVTSVSADSANPDAQSWTLSTKLPTVVGEKQVHKGMLILIALYAVVTLLYQRVMQPAAAMGDNPQAKLMQFMPLMFVGVLFFIPIPAGVMLYLVVTMLMMFVQTWWVKYTDDKSSETGVTASKQVVDIKPRSV